jgi:protein-tyrosine phosphatase
VSVLGDGLIDLHSHVLPGLDDGAPSLDGSLQIVRAAVADGVVAIAGTPHVRLDFPTQPQEMAERVAQVQARVDEEGLPLRILGGGEIAIDMLDHLDDDALRAFGLGGNPALLLLESPMMSFPINFAYTVSSLRSRGFRTVIAHPERCADVRRDPEKLRPFIDAGAVCQLTASALRPGASRETRRLIGTMLEDGLAHLVASDVHGAHVQRIGLRQALDTLGDDALSHWLGADVPRALVEGDEIPERPAVQWPKRRWPWSRD